MDEEFKMLLSNVQSLLNEIMNLVSGGQPQNNQAQMASPQMDQGQVAGPNNQMDKSLQQTSSDGTTASDPAMARLDGDLPPATAENVSDVAKSLVAQLIGQLSQQQPKQQTVVKSSEMDILAKVTDALTQIAKSQKTIAERQDVTETAITNILKGFGLAEQIEKAAQSEQTVQAPVMTNNQNSVQKGLNNPEDQAQLANLLKSIAENAQIQPQNEALTPMERQKSVRKSLTNISTLNFLTGRKG